MTSPVLDIRGLTVTLPPGADRARAVTDVSFTVHPGEIVCLVGESGSGKSIIAHTTMGLLPKGLAASSGEVLLSGEERQSDNAGAHEGGVGRDRIAAVATAVDREHTKASSREEQRGGCAGATGSDNDDVEIDRWGSDGITLPRRLTVASRVQLEYMSNMNHIWPGGIPRVGQVAKRSRTVNAKDIERFTEISGDRSPLHYDEAVAKASRFGEIVVQGGVTSAILNAVVAEDLPGPGTVFLQAN